LTQDGRLVRKSDPQKNCLFKEYKSLPNCSIDLENISRPTICEVLEVYLLIVFVSSQQTKEKLRQIFPAINDQVFPPRNEGGKDLIN
jgi:hypothetical protein